MPVRSKLLMVTIAAALAAGAATAQEFKPGNTISLVSHTGPGGGNDVLARRMALVVEQEKLLGSRMQVINRPGGGSATAMAYMVEKKGDANTLAIFANTWSVTPMVSAEAKVTMKDLTPIARLLIEPAVVVVRADSPYKTLKDFIDAARKTPGQLKQSGGSTTSRDAVVRHLLMRNTGTNWAFISFPGGGERIAALLGGHVDMLIAEPQEAGEHLRSGTMRVIAQVSERRLAAFPNVPTIREAGFDIPNVAIVRGIVGPPGLSRESVAYWEEFFARLSQTAGWKKYIEENSFEPGFQRSAEFAKSLDEFTERMRPILTEAGLKVFR